MSWAYKPRRDKNARPYRKLWMPGVRRAGGEDLLVMRSGAVYRRGADGIIKRGMHDAKHG